MLVTLLLNKFSVRTKEFRSGVHELTWVRDDFVKVGFGDELTGNSSV